MPPMPTRSSAPVAFEFIHTALAERQAQHRLRRRVVVEGGGRLIEVEGQGYLNFSSNDYLGLNDNDELRQALAEGARRYGVGATASPLVCGHHRVHQRLEAQLCEWLGYDACLLFNSGFSANQAVIKALLNKGDLLLQDKLNHASLQEAGLLSPARQRRFAHNDMGQLARLLETPVGNHQVENRLVVSEGVFSMDGDRAPLAELSRLCMQYDGWLMLDDAHGIGVLGDSGGGSVQAAGLNAGEVPLLMITFGKALGVGGAALLGSRVVVDYLLNFSRSYVYSTAMLPAQAHAVGCAVAMARAQHWRRQRLTQLRQLLQQRLAASRFTLMPSDTAIQPLLIGDDRQALWLAGQLRRRGIWASAIRPPTVPVGSARIRLTLTAAHQPADIEQLAGALAELTDAMPAAIPTEAEE